MIRLTRNRLQRIPHRLALAAATLLVVSALTGAGAFDASGELSNNSYANTLQQAVKPLANKRSFKIALFLFRYDR
jgi:hypothetical protein